METLSLYLSLATALTPDQIYTLEVKASSNQLKPISLGMDLPLMESWLELGVERSSGSDKERAREVVGSCGGDLTMVDGRPKNFSKSICFPEYSSQNFGASFTVWRVWFDTQEVAKFHNGTIRICYLVVKVDSEIDWATITAFDMRLDVGSLNPREEEALLYQNVVDVCAIVCLIFVFQPIPPIEQKVRARQMNCCLHVYIPFLSGQSHLTVPTIQPSVLSSLTSQSLILL